MALPSAPVTLTAHERAAVAAASLAIAVEGSLLGWHVARRAEHALLAVGGALDAALITLVAISIMARRHGARSIGLSPRSLARLFLLAVPLAALALRALRVPVGGALAVPIAAAEMLVLGRLVVALFRATRKHGWSSRWDQVESSLGEHLPARVAFLVTAEARLLAAAARALVRVRVRTTHDAHEAFSSTATSTYGGTLAAIVAITAIELPVVHLLLHHGGWVTSAGGHVALLLFHGYSLVWLFGEYRLLVESRHTLTEEHLRIELGIRCRAIVPLAMITGASVCARGDDRAPADTIDVTPADPPNVYLALREPIEVRAGFGRRREVRALRIFVDSPAAFVAAIARRLGASQLHA